MDFTDIWQEVGTQGPLSRLNILARHPQSGATFENLRPEQPPPRPSDSI